MNLKNTIIEAATKLFARNGFEKTTMEEIIRKAGCSKGGYYHHFKSKDEVLESIIDNYLDKLKEYFKRLVIVEYDKFPDRFNQAYAFVTGYKEKQLEDWSDIKNTLIFSGNERALRSLNRKFNEIVNDVYYQIIIQGLAREEISIDFPRETAELCTKQALWIYDAARKTINDKDSLECFYTLLDYSEMLINQQLGFKNGQIKYKDCSIRYQQKIIMMYSLHEKEER